MGQKCPKPLWLPAAKYTTEYIGNIVPRKDTNGSPDRASRPVSHGSGMGRNPAGVRAGPGYSS
jgi:hypothetical protein